MYLIIAKGDLPSVSSAQAPQAQCEGIFKDLYGKTRPETCEDNFTEKFSIKKPNLIAVVGRFLHVWFFFFQIRRELSHYQLLGSLSVVNGHNKKKQRLNTEFSRAHQMESDIPG